MKSVVNSTLSHTTTNYYPGKHYSVEEKNGALKVQKHYAAGSTIIAVCSVKTEADTLQCMISDQLGPSASTTATPQGGASQMQTAPGTVKYATPPLARSA